MLHTRVLHMVVLAALLSIATSCGQDGKTQTSSETASMGAMISTVPMPAPAGTITDPTPLVPDVLYSSSAPSSGYSYYTFTTNTAGAYIIHLTNTSTWGLSIYLELFTDAAYTAPKGGCSTGTTWQCQISNMEPNTIYYVRASSWGFGSNSFTVLFTHGLGEGSVGAPVELATGVTHRGGVDKQGTSYYALSLSEPGSYAINITDMPGSVYWRLYSDRFVTPIASCNMASWGYPDLPGDIVCEIPNLAAGTYYLMVGGSETDNNTYRLTAFRDDAGGYVDAPVPLTFESPYTAAIYPSGIDYYTVPLTTSGSFKVLITNTALDLFWELYDANSTFIMRCDWNVIGQGCVTPNLNRGTYRVRVYTRGLASGQYDITATGTGGSEGSIQQPIMVYSRTLHENGKVAGSIAYSYYTFTTENLPSDVPYIISVRGLDPNAFTNTRWALFSDPGFSYGSLVGSDCGSFWYGNMVCVTNSYHTPITLASNTTYYLTVNNSSTSSTPQTYSLMASPFDSGLGCTQGGQCFTFENGVPASFTSPDIPWTADVVNAATGSYGLTSGITKRNQTSSCFEFSATDAAWISFSVKSNFTSAYEKLHIYIDGQFYMYWDGTHPWKRTYMQTLPPGTHQYRFCHEINRTWYKGVVNPVSVDDIELIYQQK